MADTQEFLDEVLGKMGEAVAKNYESDPLKAWCTIHYFKLDEGVCIGCEAKQAILQHFQQEQERAEGRGRTAVLTALKEWAEELGVSKSGIRTRLRRGTMTDEEILTKPFNNRRAS